MKNSKKKRIPKFKNEDDEFEFWSTHDVTDYFNISDFHRVTFPNLKPSTQTISLRLSLGLLNDIKALAHWRDVPYQSLMKIMLAEQVKKMTQRWQKKT